MVTSATRAKRHSAGGPKGRRGPPSHPQPNGAATSFAGTMAGVGRRGAGAKRGAACHVGGSGAAAAPSSMPRIVGIAVPLISTAWVALIYARLAQDGVLPLPAWLVDIWEPPRTLSRMGLARILVLQAAASGSGRPSSANGRGSGGIGPLQKQARRLRVPLELLEASDASQPHFRSHILPTWVPEATCTDFVGAEFASHERAWNVAAASSGPVLILEDEVRLPPSFPRVMAQRMEELPPDFDVALAGSSLSLKASKQGPFLTKPQAMSERHAAFRGLWAYVLSPLGASRLLKLTQEARGCGEVGMRGRRAFQAVDLFVARRANALNVLAFEPPPDLAAEFSMVRDESRIGPLYRQVGIVRLSGVSPLILDGAEDLREAEEMKRTRQRLEELVGGARPFDARATVRATMESEGAFRRMRTYSCVQASQMLRDAGLIILRLLWQDPERTGDVTEAKRMLLLAVEALASSLRYKEGTGLSERQERAELQRRLDSALARRAKEGLAPVAGLGSRELHDVAWLDVETISLVEWLPRHAHNASESGDAGPSGGTADPFPCTAAPDPPADADSEQEEL